MKITDKDYKDAVDLAFAKAFDKIEQLSKIAIALSSISICIGLTILTIIL